MSSWRALDAELNAWAEAGERAELWWRDDDAAANDPALLYLLNLVRNGAPPLTIATIPAHLSDAAALQIQAISGSEVCVVQHGYAHVNHAREGERKIELGGKNSLADCQGQLREGFAILSKGFGGQFLPVLVPPWNRIDPDLVLRLPALGFGALSTYGKHQGKGLDQINCHVDILDWRNGGVFLGTNKALTLVCDHLAAKRRGATDRNVATGILSHHLRNSEDSWSFLAELFDRTLGHPGATWRTLADLLDGA